MIDPTASMPNDVEEAMADIACVFHWPLTALAAMSLGELACWRERARLRSPIASHA